MVSFALVVFVISKCYPRRKHFMIETFMFCLYVWVQTIKVINLPIKVITLQTLVTFTFATGRMTSNPSLAHSVFREAFALLSALHIQVSAATTDTSHSVKFIPFPASSILAKGRRYFHFLLRLPVSLNVQIWLYIPDSVCGLEWHLSLTGLKASRN